MATVRFNLVSRARYTSPIPPVPMSDRTSYAPRRTPGANGIGRRVDYTPGVSRAGGIDTVTSSIDHTLAVNVEHLILTGGARERLDALTPPGHAARIHLTMTDDHPFAMAVVIIEAVPQEPVT